MSLVQHLITPCLGSARFPPSAPPQPSGMAAWRLPYGRQIEVSKPNRLAEAVPPLSLTPCYGRKHVISPGAGNTLSSCHCRGMLSWHSSMVLSDYMEIPRAAQMLGQVSPACPAAPRALLRVTGTATGETPNLSYAVLRLAVASFYPAVSLGWSTVYTQSIKWQLITWSTGSVVDLLQLGNKIIICRWKVLKSINQSVLFLKPLSLQIINNNCELQASFSPHHH